MRFNKKEKKRRRRIKCEEKKGMRKKGSNRRTDVTNTEHEKRMVRCLESILIGYIVSNDIERNECVVSTADNKTILYEKKYESLLSSSNCFSYSSLYIKCRFLLINHIDNLTSFITILIHIYVPY